MCDTLFRKNILKMFKYNFSEKATTWKCCMTVGVDNIRAGDARMANRTILAVKRRRYQNVTIWKKRLIKL